ncbi:hypothetical protein M199_gp051 [Halogranum tailed virus 1]|uniref:Uncharacterized protein n=1 Tax=Halogranum tailed virus 1 TaxID=1273749 RepID=R4TGK8_9CAUD|nr:hypothetical protein M199_gp051 [Halogranum tailed virus 1]AGM11381.1 hypothetical protein HGTV1_51 [Halogranum tailed virus 1]
MRDRGRRRSVRIGSVRIVGGTSSGIGGLSITGFRLLVQRRIGFTSFAIIVSLRRTRKFESGNRNLYITTTRFQSV